MKESLTPRQERTEELLVERALRPLDDKELNELQELGAEHDESFDRAAAALVVATTVIEPVPPDLVAKILAASPAATGAVNYTRTLPGVVMPPPPDQPRDTMVGVDLEEIRLASQPSEDRPVTAPLLAQQPTATKAMPVVVAALPETLPPPKLARRPAKPAPVIEQEQPMIDPMGPTLPPENEAPTQRRSTHPGTFDDRAPAQATGPHAPLVPQPPIVPPQPQPAVRPSLRTPLPQESQPYSIEAPPLTVPIPDRMPSDHRAAQRQAAETVPLKRPLEKNRSVAPWLFAAACLAIGGGAVWWSTQHTTATIVAAPTVTPIPGSAGSPAAERTQLLATNDAKLVKLAWTATQDPNAHGASGDVVWSPSQQHGFMRFVGLVPNDPAQYQYQLWIFDKARDQAFPVDGGVFDVSTTGEVIVAINPKLHVDDLAMFAVTIEKPGGVVVSKRERIVVSATRS